MKTTALALLTVVGSVAAQGVTDSIAPSSQPPSGCNEDYQGNFEVQVIQPQTKRDVFRKKQKRADCTASGTLVARLQGGVLTDAKSRTGYIASNYQLQFDAPPQAGAIYTAGFSVCQDMTLALGGSNTWWACVSGSFYNIYDRDWADQCSQVEIEVIPCNGGGGTGQALKEDEHGASGSVKSEEGGEEEKGGEEKGKEEEKPKEEEKSKEEEKPKEEKPKEGKPEEEKPKEEKPKEEKPKEEGTQAPQAVATTTKRKVCQIVDGQIQAHDDECEEPQQTAAPQAVSESNDGQVEATAAPQAVSQSNDGQVEATAAPQAVSQSNDGQVEATTAPQAVSQSNDGQIEATVAPQAVSQSSDGQIEATAAPQAVSQSNDGQIEATAAPQAVSQSSDGQIEATAAPQAISQSNDGQIEATAAPQAVSQSNDGQIEATAAPQSVEEVSQSNDGQIEATAAPQAASQSNDGQIEATAAPQAVPESSDDQAEATANPATAPVNQIEDGQVQATSMVTARPQSVSSSKKEEETKKQEETKKETKSKDEEATVAPQGVSRSTDSQVEATAVASKTIKEEEKGGEASAKPQSAEETEFNVNWGSRSVTASVTPAWLGTGAMYSGAERIAAARLGCDSVLALVVLAVVLW